MEELISQLREAAAQCRQLAEAYDRAGIGNRLRALAEELEGKTTELQRFDGAPGAGDPRPEASPRHGL